MVEVDTCERCDGRGCRSCSGRGWVKRVLPAIPICRKDYPPVTIEHIDRMDDWHRSRPAAAVEPRAGTKKDAEVHGRGLQVEPDCGDGTCGDCPRCELYAKRPPDEREPDINTILNDEPEVYCFVCYANPCECEPTDWPPEVCRSCNQVTGIDHRNGLCADCNRELMKDEPREPDEKVRVTTQYPGHTVKLIKVLGPHAPARGYGRLRAPGSTGPGDTYG